MLSLVEENADSPFKYDEEALNPSQDKVDFGFAINKPPKALAHQLESMLPIHDREEGGTRKAGCFPNATRVLHLGWSGVESETEEVPYEEGLWGIGGLNRIGEILTRMRGVHVNIARRCQSEDMVRVTGNKLQATGQEVLQWR